MLEEPLPPLYAGWIAELLGAPIPRESQAACQACPMRAVAGETPDRRRVVFDPVVKCCTYQPALYNFLAGRILADDDPDGAAGRASVAQRLADRVGVTPLGLMRTPAFAVAYAAAETAFGRSRALKCPHYLVESGRCGVWRHRESTCATWFCKHVRGRLGFAFWRDGLHRLLQEVEIGLARWCVLEIGVSGEMLREAAASNAWFGVSEALSAESLDHAIDRVAYDRLWGEWRDREADFYGRCADLVSPLALADVLAICGPDVRASAQLTQAAFARLSSAELPAALEVGAFTVAQRRAGSTRLATYSPLDPIDVPDVVLSLLPAFDGRPTEEALASLAEHRGLQLEPELVRKLTDFGILVPPN